jgi:hypothetical protein
MDPFRIDPLNPFAAGVPGDPMEEVLSLQSYPGGEVPDMDSCPSSQSIVIMCLSNISGIEGGTGGNNT